MDVEFKENTNTEFKTNLRDQLSYLGMTVQELADKTRISKRTIENYLSRRGSIPPADYACRIANALGVSVEWLVTGHEANFFYKSTELAKLRYLIRKLNLLSPKVQDAMQSLISAIEEDNRASLKSQ